MNAVLLNSSSLPRKTAQEIETQLADVTVETIQSIASDHLARVSQLDPKNFEVGKAREALKGGVWYSVEYLQLLKKANGALSQKERNLLNLGYANTHYFTRLGTNEIFWISKPDVSASEALDAAIKGPTIADCGITCNLARHKAVRDVIGKERYDKVFKGRLVLVYPHPDSFDVLTQIAKRENQTKRGAIVGRPNHPNYPTKHPFGDFPSFNLIQDGKGNHIGLGTPKEGLTVAEVDQMFVDEFNKPYNPLRDGAVSQEQLDYQWSQHDEATIKKMVALNRDRRIGVKDLPKPDDTLFQEFRLNTIRLLRESPLEKLTPEFIRNVLGLGQFDRDIEGIKLQKARKKMAVSDSKQD